MELAIHWSPTKVQRVLALVNIAVECTHLCGSPDKFPGPEASVDGNWVAQCEGEGGVAFPEYWMIALPHEYTVYVSPIPECILGINVLQELWLHTTVGESCLQA